MGSMGLEVASVMSDRGRVEWVYEDVPETEAERRARAARREREESENLKAWLTVFVLANVVVYFLFSGGC